MSFAEEYADASAENWALFNAALVNYRAGHHRWHFLLEQSNYTPNSLPLQALLEHQAGQATSAVKSLDAALRVGYGIRGKTAEQ